MNPYILFHWFCITGFCTFSDDPLPSLYWWVVSVGGEELRTPSANEPARPHIVHTVQLKPMVQAHSSGRMISSGISDAVIASVYSEKIRLKIVMMRIIISSNRKSIY